MIEDKSRDYPFDPFVNGIIEPSVPPSAGNKVCIELPIEYLPYVQGSMGYLTKLKVHLRNEGATLESAINYASWFSEFLDMVSTNNACNNPPGGYVVGSWIGQVVSGMWPEVADIPYGLLPMDGSSHLKSEYPELWELLSRSTYAPLYDDSPTHFTTPIRTRRSGVGVDDTSFGLFSEVGSSGGSETHTLTNAQIPSHTHPQTINTLTPGGGATGSVAVNGGTGAPVFYSNTGTAGGGEAHNNMPPFHVERFCIVAKVNEPMSHSFRLRQNTENPNLLEQSVDGGAFYEAFDYGKARVNCVGGVDLGVGDISIVNNYFTTINNAYDGTVTNIYNDAVYGTGDAGDDTLRDSTLCYVIYETMVFIDELINSQVPESEERPGIGDLINGAVDTFFNMIAYGSIVTGAFTLSGGNPYVTGLVATVLAPAFKDEADNWTNLWNDFWGSTPTIDRTSYYEDLACCVYGYLQGQTITQELLSEGMAGCMGLAENIPYTQLFETMAFAIFGSLEVFPAFLDRLQTGFTAQKAGIGLPCPCAIETCIDIDFRVESDTDPFTVEIDSTFVIGQGVYSDVIGERAAVAIEWDQSVTVTSIEVEWRRPKNVPPGSGGNNVTVDDHSAGYLGNIVNTGSTGTAGTTISAFNDVNRVVNKIKIFAIGSSPEVANLQGLIYRIKVCWEGEGVPV